MSILSSPLKFLTWRSQFIYRTQFDFIQYYILANCVLGDNLSETSFCIQLLLTFCDTKKWKGIYKVSALKLIETLFLLNFFQVKLKNHIEKICFILSDMYNVAWPTISFCPHEPSSSFSFFLCFLWGVIITARSKISQTPKLSWSIRPHHNSVISLLKNFNSKKILQSLLQVIQMARIEKKGNIGSMSVLLIF